MAYHGELVRMENGRWARFQECVIYKDGQRGTAELPMLVAVELDEQLQTLLNDQEELYEDHQAPVRLEAMPEGKGPIALTYGL
jgi:hypothetical protein